MVVSFLYGVLTMSEVEPSFIALSQSGIAHPRNPCREVAQLLATAMLRLRASQSEKLHQEESAVRLDSSCHQSVHTNPSQLKGVCK
jgi:hypothetical protein